MITRMSHCTLWVEDQDEALAFYTDKLGFEVRMDNSLEGFRWLTVSPKGQRDLEIVLMPLKPNPMHDSDTIAQLKALLAKGALGSGVMHTDDCKKTYEQLKAKGVQFMQEPTERPYGTEAVFKDNSGNWFSLTQPKL